MRHPVYGKNQYMVDIAQLVRAPDCGSGGRGFESHYPPHEIPLFCLLTKEGYFNSIRLAASFIGFASDICVASDIACGQLGANRITLRLQRNIGFAKQTYHTAVRRHIT